MSQVSPADIEWRNGLPFSREFDDIYFSPDDGVSESRYVFVEGCQLLEDWQAEPEKDFFLAELGFGSGLNFLVTAFQWQDFLQQQNETDRSPRRIGGKNQTCHKTSADLPWLNYVSIEKRPFTREDFLKCSQQWPQFSSLSERLYRDYPSTTFGRHQIIFPEFRLTLTLMFMPVEQALDDLLEESKRQQHKTQFDHWFLDGFAPGKNQSMWNEEVAQKLAQLSKQGTRLATFSVAAAVKKPLVNAGFEIRKRKGFAYKREMLTAQLLTQPQSQPTRQFVNLKFDKPWFNLSVSQKTKKIAIIGGGIAGCATAYCLTRKNIEVTLFDSSKTLAAGASGAAAGIFHPQLTSDFNLNSQFGWLAYLKLTRFLSQHSCSSALLSKGVIRYLADARQKEKLMLLAERLRLVRWIKEHTLLDTNPTDGSKHSSSSRSLLFPHAAVVDMPRFCQLLIEQANPVRVELRLATSVISLRPAGDHWLVKTDNTESAFDQVIYCGGAKSSLLDHFTDGSTHISRGQTCFLDYPPLSTRLKQALCEQVYLAARNRGGLHIGTTFESCEKDGLCAESQQDILTRTAAFLSGESLPFLSQEEWLTLPLTGTYGYRLHSRDRLPLVGAAIDSPKLEHDFDRVGQKRIALSASEYYNRKGLWLNTAYGSHGLLYSLIASEHLASLITGGISPLSTKLAEAVHPARFSINNKFR